MSSLPVPDSPVMSTGALVCATRCAVARTDRRTGDWPTTSKWDCGCGVMRLCGGLLGCGDGLVQEDGCFYPVHQYRIAPRLGDEVESSVAHTLNSKVDGAPCCHEDDGHIRTEHFYLLQQRKPFLAICGKGIVHVHQHQFQIRMAAYHIHRCRRAFGAHHRIFISLQQQRERHSDGSIIINYQNHRF